MEETKSKKEKRSKEPDLVIPLRKPYTQLVLAALFFGACAAFMFYRASTNDRGLILNGIIHFEPGGADVFYAVMGLLSFGFVVMGALGIYNYARIDPFELVIGTKHISMPSGRPTGVRRVEVRFEDIHSIEVFPPTGKAKSILLRTADGVHSISTMWLPGDGDVSQIRDALVQRLRSC